MAGIPQNFQSLSNVLPTYQFIDILSGTGYITFYLGKTVDLKVISNSAFYAETVSTSASVPASSLDVNILDEDFDVLLNRPMDIQGLAIVNLPIAALRAGAGNIQIYAKVYLRKWDGSTETEIVNNQSNYLATVDANTIYKMSSIDLTVPLTHFKKGEYLRVTVRLYVGSDTISTGTAYYAHDPASRTAGWDGTGVVPSRLSVYLPVRLNL